MKCPHCNSEDTVQLSHTIKNRILKNGTLRETTTYQYRCNECMYVFAIRFRLQNTKLSIGKDAIEENILPGQTAIPQDNENQMA